jgi:hypothetical protein
VIVSEYGLAMTLTVDPAKRQQREYECSCCNAAIERTWNFIDRDGEPWAVYFANCYHHRDQPHDTWIDVIMGTWGDDDVDGVNDHVTFGCRVGPVADSVFPAATLVDALQGFTSTPVHGMVLSREQGLAHPLLPQFWEIVDFVLENDPTVHAHLYSV